VVALALAIVATVASVAVASGGDGTRVSVGAAATERTTTSTHASTTVLSSTTATAPTVATSTPQSSAPPAGTSSPPPPDPGADPTTTVAPASPWPPGTVVDDYLGNHITGRVVFTPETAVSGTDLAFTATLTNRADHWTFGKVYFPGLALYLHSPITDGMIPAIRWGPRDTAPEFQHQTASGVATGLLLAPGASYSWSGTINNQLFDPRYVDTDYVVQADVVYAPVGVANGSATITANAGSFTVMLPATTTTGN
jgi:hypothetical protein